MVNEPIIFIVGNSRSGTTMLMRILNRHAQIHAINEPHFFERYWKASDNEMFIGQKEAVELFSKLLYVQREGHHQKIDLNLYRQESSIEIEKFSSTKIYKVDVYRHFLFYETEKQKKSIPCEKTPQNIFYLDELYKLFPNAKVINLIRDPRSVMLSQKQKWKRRKLGANFLSTKELIRLRINYHPITISKLWNSSVETSLKYSDRNNFVSIKYEDLITNSEETVQSLCNYLEIPFTSDILKIPQKGSSSIADDPNNIGIRSNRVDAWKNGKLSKAELYLSEKITQKLMKKFSYELSHTKPNPISYLLYLLSFPVKIVLALLWNWRRISSIKDAIHRRLSKSN